MLIALTVAGVAIGLLAQLYFANPSACLGLVMALSTVLPFLLATGTLIRLGWRSKQRSVAVWGTVLLLTPIAGSALVFLLQSFARPGSGGLGVMSNKQIMQRELPKDMDGYQVWEELEYRAKNNNLSAGEVDQVVGSLAAYGKKKHPRGWSQPLHRQEEFMRLVRKKDLISKDILVDMCDAYFGSPRIRPYNAATASGQDVHIEYGTPWNEDHHHGLGVAHVWSVKELLVDGKPLELKRQYHRSDNWNGDPKEPISKDAKELTAKVDVAYLYAEKLIGLDTRNLPIERWPKAIKRWTKTIKIPLDGSDPLKKPLPPLKLATDPKWKPAAPSIDRLVVQMDAKADNFRTLVVRMGEAVRPPIPISFDVFVMIDETKLSAGKYYVIPRKNGISYGGTELITRGHLIDSTAEYADVIFEPNVEHLQKRLANSDESEDEKIKMVWGKPFAIREVKLERLDLEFAE